ncbi:MAG: nuclear transport factor 2 family protein [Deltaproteobacteria bacterium]|nr:nuclear transport factor 2 family protein [Deltaproteobacteria bacterium]
MSDTSGALMADREFFKALTDGNGDALDRLLADEFILIDVMRGAEVAKTALVELVGSRQLRFESITPADVYARRYGSTAIVSGRTTMRLRFEQTSVTVKSRYTHIYIEDHGSWRMVSAQGTQISDG